MSSSIQNRMRKSNNNNNNNNNNIVNYHNNNRRRIKSTLLSSAIISSPASSSLGLLDDATTTSRDNIIRNGNAQSRSGSGDNRHHHRYRNQSNKIENVVSSRSDYNSRRWLHPQPSSNLPSLSNTRPKSSSSSLPRTPIPPQSSQQQQQRHQQPKSLTQKQKQRQQLIATLFMDIYQMQCLEEWQITEMDVYHLAQTCRDFEQLTNQYYYAILHRNMTAAAAALVENEKSSLFGDHCTIEGQWKKRLEVEHIQFQTKLQRNEEFQVRSWRRRSDSSKSTTPKPKRASYRWYWNRWKTLVSLYQIPSYKNGILLPSYPTRLFLLPINPTISSRKRSLIATAATNTTTTTTTNNSYWLVICCGSLRNTVVYDLQSHQYLGLFPDPLFELDSNTNTTLPMIMDLQLPIEMLLVKDRIIALNNTHMMQFKVVLPNHHTINKNNRIGASSRSSPSSCILHHKDEEEEEESENTLNPDAQYDYFAIWEDIEDDKPNTKHLIANTTIRRQHPLLLPIVEDDDEMVRRNDDENVPLSEEDIIETQPPQHYFAHSGDDDCDFVYYVCRRRYIQKTTSSDTHDTPHGSRNSKDEEKDSVQVGLYYYNNDSQQSKKQQQQPRKVLLGSFTPITDATVVESSTLSHNKNGRHTSVTANLQLNACLGRWLLITIRDSGIYVFDLKHNQLVDNGIMLLGDFSHVQTPPPRRHPTQTRLLKTMTITNTNAPIIILYALGRMTGIVHRLIFSTSTGHLSIQASYTINGFSNSETTSDTSTTTTTTTATIRNNHSPSQKISRSDRQDCSSFTLQVDFDSDVIVLASNRGGGIWTVKGNTGKIIHRRRLLNGSNNDEWVPPLLVLPHQNQYLTCLNRGDWPSAYILDFE